MTGVLLASAFRAVARRMGDPSGTEANWVGSRVGNSPTQLIGSQWKNWTVRHRIKEAAAFRRAVAAADSGIRAAGGERQRPRIPGHADRFGNDNNVASYVVGAPQRQETGVGKTDVCGHLHRVMKSNRALWLDMGNTVHLTTSAEAPWPSDCGPGLCTSTDLHQAIEHDHEACRVSEPTASKATTPKVINRTPLRLVRKFPDRRVR